MSNLLIFVFVLLATAAFYGLSRLRRDQLADLELHEKFAKDFYALARPLMESDDTPDDVLDLLEFANQRITDPDAPREFYEFARRGRLAGDGNLDRKRAIRAFFSQRPDLEAHYGSALWAALLAMSFNSLRYGPRIRLLLTAIDSSDGREQVAELYKETTEEEHGGEPLPQAA